ncbi:MAG: FAD-dependent oxidoreductase, partial [Duodenibacillus sp.]|nr:FAD-dependent oxidoreductase [Duodenibacillus sp.]
MNITRRALARTAVAAAVASAVPFAFAAQKTLSADLVVVGAGSAGLTAAVQAAEKGAKVILLEKNPFIGGNSQHAEGVFGVESEYNRLRSDTLTREEAWKGLMERHQYMIDANLTRDYVYGSGENAEWLGAHGVKIEVVRMTPWEEATWHVFADYKGIVHGAALIQCFKDHADKLGVQTMTSTPATDLIVKDGAVAGVKAKDEDGNELVINAKAVILASGSFGDDPKLVAEWAHKDPEGWKSCVPINKTGDGILMAMRAGAARGPVGFVGHTGSHQI